MTLFELQAWLGHASPETTQHYAKITPNTLTRAYQGRRLLRAQRPHHRGPHRPRRRRLRAGRSRRAVAALRPRPRAVLLHLLRAVPAPHGLRQVRLLHPEELLQGPAARSQGQPAADAHRHPAHRRRDEPPSTTARKHSTSYSTGSPTPRHPTGPRPASSPAVLPSLRCCRSCPARRPDRRRCRKNPKKIRRPLDAASDST